MTGRKPGPPGKRGRPRGIRIQGEFGCKVCQHPEAARISFLLASGGVRTAIAAQFGISITSVNLHFKNHITTRYKRLIGSFRVENFDALLRKAAEGDGESLDILNLLIRGHLQGWSLALESGSGKEMSHHTARVLQAVELRAKITRELTGTPTIQVNTFLTRDAGELLQVLERFPEAAQAVVEWHQRRSGGLIEHIEHVEHVSAAD